MISHTSWLKRQCQTPSKRQRVRKTKGHNDMSFCLVVWLSHKLSLTFTGNQFQRVVVSRLAWIGLGLGVVLGVRLTAEKRTNHMALSVSGHSRQCSGGSKHYEKEEEDILSAHPFSFIANAHNEIYAFYTEKRLLKKIWANGGGALWIGHCFYLTIYTAHQQEIPQCEQSSFGGVPVADRIVGRRSQRRTKRCISRSGANVRSDA